MRTKITIFIFCMLTAMQTKAQKTFEKTFGVKSTLDQPADIYRQADGTFIILGSTVNKGKGMLDFYLVKTKEDGTVLWEKTFGTAKNDIAVKLLPLGDGYILAGYNESYTSLAQPFVVKTDTGGNISWIKSYVIQTTTKISTAAVCADGGFLIAGESMNAAAQGNIPFFLKADKTGKMEWTYSFTQYAAEKNIVAVAATPDSGFAMTYDDAGYNCHFFKIDKKGKQTWEKVVTDLYSVIPYDMIRLKNGGYAIAGRVGNSDPYIATYDKDGEVVWEQVLTLSTFGVTATSIQEDNTGKLNFLITTDYKANPEDITNNYISSIGADGTSPSFTYLDFNTAYTIATVMKKDASGIYYTGICHIQGGHDIFFKNGNDEKVIGKIGPADDETGRNMIKTKDGGYLMVGSATHTADPAAFYVVKADANGTQEWEQTYDGGSSSECVSATETADGGYIFYGSSGGQFGMIVKTDNKGNKIWTKKYDSFFPLGLGTIHETKDGNLILSGCKDDGSSNRNPCLVKLNSSGDTLWIRQFGKKSSFVSDGSDVIETSDGNYLMGGFVNDISSARDFLIVKADPSGNILWQKIFGGPNGQRITSVLELSDGNYAAFGNAQSLTVSGPVFDPFLMKLKPNGDTLWTRRYPEKNIDAYGSYVVREDKNKNLFLFGTHDSTTNKFQQGYILKTDASGKKLWNKAIGAAPSVMYTGIAESDGSLDMFGYAQFNNSWDMYLLKANSSGSLTNIVICPGANNILSIFPNPGKEELNLSMNNEEEGDVKITFTDMQGNAIMSRQAHKKAGAFLINLPVGEFPAGFFIIQMEMNGQVSYGKWVKE